MFETLNNRYFFTGELVMLNDLHIGSGRGDGRTDALVIKDYKGFPFVPGSSFRGAFRSIIERVCNTLGAEPCLLIKGNPCVTTETNLQNEFKQLLKDRKYTDAEAFLCNDAKICSVCQVFGSAVTGSKLRVSDMPLIGEFINTAIRDCVGIDRDTETASVGVKFDFEAVAKDSRFAFELIGENLTPRDLGLIAIGMQELCKGNFWIGGNSSRGLGRCKIETFEIRYFEGKDGLLRYLSDKALLNSLTTPVFMAKIQEAFTKEAAC